MASGAKSSSLIFICVDESEHAMRAFDWFSANLYRDEHTIGLVHIYSSPVSQHANKLASVEDTDYETRMVDAVQKSRNVVAEYVEKCNEKGMKVQVLNREKSESESVGRTICNMVKEMNPTCVVIGQRGLGTVKRTLFGSVSDYVLHHAHLPVVIVPPPK